VEFLREHEHDQVVVVKVHPKQEHVAGSDARQRRSGLPKSLLKRLVKYISFASPCDFCAVSVEAFDSGNENVFAPTMTENYPHRYYVNDNHDHVIFSCAENNFSFVELEKNDNDSNCVRLLNGGEPSQIFLTSHPLKSRNICFVSKLENCQVDSA